MTVNARRIVRALAVLGVCASVIATGVIGLAHAKLEKSEPADKATLTAAPVHVQLWFNEAPDVKTSKIELKGAAGAVNCVVAVAESRDQPVWATGDRERDGHFREVSPGSRYRTPRWR